jgi:hypothetical protein
MTFIYIMQNAGNTPTKQLSLYDSLRVGYIPSENQQGQEMSKYGYQIDKGLSNDNQQVYYNPQTNKLLYNVTGSHNLSDWVNSDLKLALGIKKNQGKPIIERGIESLLPNSWKKSFDRGYENTFGGFKDTTRYKQADDTLKAAKSKYNPADVTITGHSLGGRIVQDIAKSGDKVYALDAGQTIGQKVKGGANRNIYRSAGDVVSLASAYNPNVQTLTNPHTSRIIPALFSKNPTTIGVAAAIDAYNAHNIENIKQSDIFV